MLEGGNGRYYIRGERRAHQLNYYFSLSRLGIISMCRDWERGEDGSFTLSIQPWDGGDRLGKFYDIWGESDILLYLPSLRKKESESPQHCVRIKNWPSLLRLNIHSLVFDTTCVIYLSTFYPSSSHKLSLSFSTTPCFSFSLSTK